MAGGSKVNVVVKFANQVRMSWLPIILIQKIHPIVELSVFWIQLSNLNYMLRYDRLWIYFWAKQNVHRAIKQRHESIKRLQEQSSTTRYFRRSLYPSSVKHLSNKCKIQVKLLTYQPDPTATIWRQYLINLRKKASEEGVYEWFDVVDTSLALLWHFSTYWKRLFGTLICIACK